MTRVRLGLIAILWVLLPGAAAGQELPFANYTPASDRNPLPSAEVIKVFQDSGGYLWFVIFSSGVVRYDGHSFESYSTSDGLKDLAVWEIVEDGASRLWIGSNAGLVVSERPLGDYAAGERIQFVSTVGTVELVETVVNRNRLAADARGRVWAGTSSTGIVRYHVESDGDSLRATCDTLSTDVRGEGKNPTVRSIAVRRDGSVWASIGGGNLLAFPEGSDTPSTISQDAGLPTQSVTALYESPAGVLWGGCRDGLLWRLDESGGEPRVVTVSNRLASNIGGMLATSDSTFWVASEGSGVMKFDPARPDHAVVITRANGLLSDNVHHICRDLEGSLWFSQSGGASKLRVNYGAFTSYTAAPQADVSSALPSPAVNVVIPPSATGDPNALWIGTTEGGVVAIRRDGAIASIDAHQGLCNNWVNGLVFDHTGRLWMGTASGINCLSLDPRHAPPASPRRTKVRVFDKDGVLASYRNTSVYACFRHDIPGRGGAVESLWFAGIQNLFCFVDGRWWVLREHAGLPVTSFHAVAVDDNRHVWVGTRDRGLYRSVAPFSLEALESSAREPVPLQPEEGEGVFGDEITNPLFEPVWSRELGAPTNQIETIAWRNGALWVGTPVGLFLFEGEPARVVKHFTRDDGLEATNATAMAFSPSGSLWVGTNGGLSEIDPAARTVLRSVTRQDGLVGNEVWFYGSVASGDDGTVYFGTAQGLSLYSPRLDRPNPTPPLVRFRNVSFQEDNRGHNELAVEYAALSYSKETRVRYRTRLRGYDRDWSPETSEVKTRYTNLPAFFLSREYAFEVTAHNGDGVWTPTPLVYTFRVSPPVWFRWWALAGQFLLVGGSLYGAHEYRTRSLERRARLLEHVVEVRTQEVRAQAETLQEQNVELENKNAEIVRTQQQLIVQEKLASLGALTAGIAHEIRNPLNFVNNFAELSGELVQDLRDDLAKQKDKLEADAVRGIDELLGDLEQNMSRINEHGKRANSIVHGMLLHSRGQKGEFQKTKLNALLDEFATIALVGMKANDPTMAVTLEKEFDPAVREIDAIPQDLSRVFVNIVNNACYATTEKQKTAGAGYAPVVRLSTRSVGDRAEVRIRDNGNGIPDAIREKIFAPFFTTKPTGAGTGLGLSISYDIVVQEHHGELRVETQAGEFTEFVISLPRRNR
jgi:signal transduction histidine kinase/ligand-binding sensor domain-containing protein